MSTKHTRAEEAQSAESVIVQARELEPTIRKLLEGINAVLEREPAPAATSRPEPAVSAEVRHGYLECALRHLRCADSLLADGEPATAEMEDVGEVVRSAAENLTTWLDGVATADDSEQSGYVFDALDATTCAAALIEAGLNPRNSKTVCSTKGILRLGADRLAEIIEDHPSDTAAETIRPAAKAPELPEALADHLQEQHTRVSELLSLLRRLDEDCDEMYSRIAVREAEELERALDSMTLGKVLKGEEARPA